MEKETAAIWTCEVCGKDFPTKALLATHLAEEVSNAGKIEIAAFEQMRELNG